MIKFLTDKNVKPSKIIVLEMLFMVLQHVDRTNVNMWILKWRASETLKVNIDDECHNGRPVYAADEKHLNEVDELILSDRRMLEQRITNRLNRSKIQVEHIAKRFTGKYVTGGWIFLQHNTRQHTSSAIVHRGSSDVEIRKFEPYHTLHNHRIWHLAIFTFFI